MAIFQTLAAKALQLGLSETCDRALRYQLVHRTASAVLEAQRFLASKTVLVVHSFSGQQEGFTDFQAFARQLGAAVSGPGELVQAGNPSGVELFVGWAQGPVALKPPVAV